MTETQNGGQTGAETGLVRWHIMMSLDGFIAGPNHDMAWMSGVTVAPGTVEAYAASTGAILAGRRWHDAFAGIPEAAPYGGLWSGSLFVLTHHPEDAAPAEGVTYLNCDVAEAVETGLRAAGGKDLVVFGADIARQCVARGLIDEFTVHLAPVMLGDGIRLYESAGSPPVRWERVHDGDPRQVVDLRYRPAGR
jgi:dihydrofolate reductase